MLRNEFADMLVEVSARRSRAVLLIFGVALSIGVLVASLAVSASAARQIDADVAASVSRTFTLKLREPPPGTDLAPFPADTDARAERVPLVTAAGRRMSLAKADVTVSRLAPALGVEPVAVDVSIVALTSGYFPAAEVRIDSPVSFLLDSDHPYPVALVGPAAARALGVPARGPLVGVRIWINDRAYSVIGRLDAGAAAAGLDNVVAVPLADAGALAPVTPLDTEVLVRTDVGASGPVSRVIRSAIRPAAPESMTVSAVSDFSALRTGVSDQLAKLSAGVGALLLGLAMLLIANAMVVSVVSRTGEIGLRRSLGASRSAVARIFLLEGALAGGLGGLTGAAIGVLASLAVAVVNDWSFRFPYALAAVAPVLGVIVAIIASAYPAWRAANVQPAEALSSD